jgi:hypothetical protein
MLCKGIPVTSLINLRRMLSWEKTSRKTESYFNDANFIFPPVSAGDKILVPFENPPLLTCLCCELKA